MQNRFEKIVLFFSLSLLSFAVIFTGCQKSSNSGNTKSQLQVSLTDSPDTSVTSVWVDVQAVKIVMAGDTSEITLSGAHPGVYNLMDLTNGKDTILADAQIPAGTISQIRLVLGSNNYITMRSSGNTPIPLTTPSGQQSGLKVQIHEDVSGGILYRLILDFDAAQSIVSAGNSGNFILKPVLRVISFVPSGGDVKGVVMPDSVRTTIFAITGTDTISSTYSDTTNGQYLIKNIPAGNYTFSFVPNDTVHLSAQATGTVTLGQTTILDTVLLQHK